MRYTNSSLGASNRLSPKRLIILGLLLLVVIVSLFLLTNRDEEPANTGEYYDPVSGETVSDPPGKSPETYGVEDKHPVYLGFSKLLDVGVTEFQLEAAKTAFDTFSEEKYGKKAEEISVDVSTVKQTPFEPDSTTRSVTFDIVLNRRDKYQATLSYSSIRSARLTLHQAGSEVFNSGVIEPDEHGD